MNAAELLDKSLYEARQHLAAGTVSPAELTSAALDRIHGDPDARACFLRLRPKEAAAQAASCKVDLSPVAGIPLAHKDLFAVRDDVVTFGTDRSLHLYCHEHADVLTALDQAGAVNLGGLHMAEFAMGASGWNEPWGFLTNPLDPERVSGGSSSGSAAAVARRLVFGALGTDTGGSTRVPASFCGVVGFKPTNGLISTRGVFPVSPTLDTVGTLARNVRDCALLLDAICPRTGFADSLDDAPDSSVSFGVFRPEALPTPPDAEALAVLERVAGALRDAGYSLEDVSSSLPNEANTMSGLVFLSEAASVHLRHLRTQPKSIGPQVRNRLLLGLTYPATVYIQALREREGFVARWKQLPRLMLCPSTPCLAPLRHIYPSMSADEIIALNGRLGSYTASSNYLGIPALSVPVRLDDGMVIGIQIMGRPGEDALVLRAGRKLEALLKD